MASDREILREVWEGKLPVCFKIDIEEVVDIKMPDPYYLMVPRLSYFPLVTDKVKKHFIKSVESVKQNSEMWLDFNGTPLKWHYPIGLLYDMNNSEIVLPWNITVHFDKFPDDELLHCHSKETVETHFISCLKEADVLKHKNQIVSNLQKKDHHQLLQGLQYDKFDLFWNVNRKLMDVGSEDCFKYIPFRCYTKNEPVIQKLIRPISEEGQRKTLAHLLELLFPESDVASWQVVIHGIEPPLETPLQWMSEHLSYPDNFLHLFITSKTENLS